MTYDEARAIVVQARYDVKTTSALTVQRTAQLEEVEKYAQVWNHGKEPCPYPLFYAASDMIREYGRW